VPRVSPGFLCANGFLSLNVSFAPFPTSVHAEHPANCATLRP